MPATRRTRARARMIINQTSVTGENIGVSTTTKDLEGSSIRTLTSNQTSLTTNSAPLSTDGPYQKKTRNSGPIRGRPIQLELTNEDGGEDQQQQRTAIDNGGGGKGKGPTSKRILCHHLQHRPSAGNAIFPPISSGPSHEGNEHDGTNGSSTDSEAETEEDWLDPSLDQFQITELSRRRFPSKLSEAMAIERPLWDGSANLTGSNSVDAPSTPQEGSGAPMPMFAAMCAPTHEPTPMPMPIPTPMPIPIPMSTPVSMPIAPGVDGVWPVDTELIYVAGTMKVMLTAQRPVMQTVIQDAFENVRTSLLFDCAFPDASVIPSIIREALVVAARSNMPRASNIHGRLLMDEVFVAKLSRLPRARIPLFRGDVKECCASIVQMEFVTLHGGQSISEVVEKQLSNYYYTHPVSGHSKPLLVHTRPYRNLRIIAVIRQLYFEGGTTSFVHRFESQFPRHIDEDGVTVMEVPIPMVALVATALYAALYEWRTGRHQSTDFSSNTFMDVYQGHVDTFNHIRERRKSAFQLMMSDIYVLANSSGALGVPGVTGGVHMAQINIDELEG